MNGAPCRVARATVASSAMRASVRHQSAPGVAPEVVVAAGAPILSLTFLWGGVPFHFIVIGYVTTFVCIVSSGAIAASMSDCATVTRKYCPASRNTW